MDTIQAISTVGFPIVAFLLMFWQSCTIIKANTSAMENLKDIIQQNLK
jgi:hypothetical protein